MAAVLGSCANAKTWDQLEAKHWAAYEAAAKKCNHRQTCKARVDNAWLHYTAFVFASDDRGPAAAGEKPETIEHEQQRERTEQQREKEIQKIAQDAQDIYDEEMNRLRELQDHELQDQVNWLKKTESHPY